MPRPFFTLGKDPVPIVQEAGRDPGLVLTGAEYLAPTGIRSPDHSARSQSLYRLHYLAHFFPSTPLKITVNKTGNVSIKLKSRRIRGDLSTVEEH